MDKTSRISFIGIFMFFLAIVGITYLFMESLADKSFWAMVAILSILLIVILAFVSTLRH